MKEKYQNHAKSGLADKLPKIEIFENNFQDYEITIIEPEFTSVCPKTGLPDFGTITIKYIPGKFCAELKSLKAYFNSYRNIGIFMENSVNRILKDFVFACKPKKAEIAGDFNPRGGIKTVVKACYPKGHQPKKK
ncbi:MAG: preQ(1) synthase [Candidatus Saganbacteria bacterium]|nr:preQ(1) synthase [Candidatus Saganbacteria bacterium]